MEQQCQPSVFWRSPLRALLEVLLRRAAHTWRESLGNLKAHAAFGVARRLEMMGRSGDLSQAEAAWTALEEEIERLASQPTALKGETVACAS